MYQHPVDRLPGLRPSRFVTFVIIALAAFAALALPARPALATCGLSTPVASEAALTAAIDDYNAQAGPCSYIITLTANITLTGNLPIISNTNAQTDLTIDGGGFTIGDDGGEWTAIRVDNDEVTLQNVTLDDMGTGIEAANGADVFVIDVTLTDTAYTSVFSLNSTVTLLRVVAEGNQSFNTALSFFSSTVIADELIIRNNEADGIVAIDSEVTLRTSTISDNLFRGILVDGGSAYVRDSTISGNEVGISGFGGTVEVINSTIAENLFDGIDVTDTSLTLINATVARNNEFGIDTTAIQPDTPLTIQNTIVADNGESDCYTEADPGASFDLLIEHSLFTDTGTDACGLAAANPDGDGNIVGQPALLAPLGDYGGPTETIGLLALGGSLSAVSPAIDTGDNALADDPNDGPLQYDQRGAPNDRIDNGTVDMGAYEGFIPILCPAFPATVTTEIELNTAIVCYNGISTPGAYTITFGADITLTQPAVPVDNSTAGVSLIIEGTGQTLDGDDIPGVRPLTIWSDTTVTVRDLTVTGGNIADLLSPNDGGGIHNRGTLTLERVTVTGNATGDDGGGIYTALGSTTTIIDSFITDNTAGAYADGEFPGDGGGINNEGVMTITNSVISGNQALGTDGVNGGGIFNEGDLTLTGSTVDNNEVRSDDDELFGGGIVNQAALIIRDSTISNNRIVGESGQREFAGGGIFHQGGEGDVDPLDSLLVLINSTVSGNSVSGGDEVFGGGIFVRAANLVDLDPTQVLLVNTTVSDNSISSDEATPVGGGGGLYFVRTDDSVLEVGLGNSIVANSSTFGQTGASGEDCVLDGDVDFISQYTLYEATGSGACDMTNDADGNLTGVDPLLGALGNNGGPTLTHLPQVGSDAIDSGNNSLALDYPSLTQLTADQRGFTPRIVNSTVDRGSVEVDAQPPAAGFCPAEDPNVGNEMTSLIGRGMGSPTKAAKRVKLVVPNAGDLTALYGQLAAVDVGVMKWVRFAQTGEPTIQINPPTSPAYRQWAVDWWGTELAPKSPVKAAFFVGPKAARAPRGLVLWPTYGTGEAQYANVFTTFDDSFTNHVYWNAGWNDEAVQTLDIPETQAAGAEITVHVALVDNQDDPRPVVLTVTPLPGGTPFELVLFGPNVPGKPKGWQNTLNLETIVLSEVPAGVNQIEIKLLSPQPFALIGDSPITGQGGDSAAMIGASAYYPCGEVPVR